MSTIYVFQNEVQSADILATDDAILVYDRSTGRTSQLTGAQIQDKVATSEVVGTISNTGISVLGNSTTGTQAYLLADPVAGRRKTIVNASLSTLGKTVTVASTASGYSSLTKIGTSDTIVTFTGANQQIDLIGLSTTKWQVLSMFGTTANPVLS